MMTYRESGGDDRSGCDTEAVRAAWARASNLSANGLLHEAVMEFLRIRTVLQEQNWQLHALQAASGPGGSPPDERIMSAAHSAVAETSPVWTRVEGVMDKLLGQVDQEVRSHLQFLQNNHYAALQLPLPGDSSAASKSRITDRVVKGNYRRLALRFHPDKTGGTNSGGLFAVIRAAYENLANSRLRDLYQRVRGCSTADCAIYRWAVDVEAATEEPGSPTIDSTSKSPGLIGRQAPLGQARNRRRRQAPSSSSNFQHNIQAPGDCVPAVRTGECNAVQEERRAGTEKKEQKEHEKTGKQEKGANESVVGERGFHDVGNAEAPPVVRQENGKPFSGDTFGQSRARGNGVDTAAPEVPTSGRESAEPDNGSRHPPTTANPTFSLFQNSPLAPSTSIAAQGTAPSSDPTCDLPPTLKRQQQEPRNASFEASPLAPSGSVATRERLLSTIALIDGPEQDIDCEKNGESGFGGRLPCRQRRRSCGTSPDDVSTYRGAEASETRWGSGGAGSASGGAAATAEMKTAYALGKEKNNHNPTGIPVQREPEQCCNAPPIPSMRRDHCQDLDTTDCCGRSSTTDSTCSSDGSGGGYRECTDDGGRGEGSRGVSGGGTSPSRFVRRLRERMAPRGYENGNTTGCPFPTFDYQIRQEGDFRVTGAHRDSIWRGDFAACVPSDEGVSAKRGTRQNRDSSTIGSDRSMRINNNDQHGRCAGSTTENHAAVHTSGTNSSTSDSGTSAFTDKTVGSAGVCCRLSAEDHHHCGAESPLDEGAFRCHRPASNVPREHFLGQCLGAHNDHAPDRAAGLDWEMFAAGRGRSSDASCPENKTESKNDMGTPLCSTSSRQQNPPDSRNRLAMLGGQVDTLPPDGTEGKPCVAAEACKATVREAAQKGTGCGWFWGAPRDCYE